MFLKENQVGLSIFNNKIQFVELKFDNNKYFLENIDEEYFEDKLDFSDEENFIYILQNSFNKLSERINPNTNYISISLPPELFLTASIPIDTQLSAADMAKHNNWELSQLFPKIDLENYSFRSLRSDSSIGELIKNNIYVGTKKSLLKLLHQFSIKNNFALKFVDASNIVSHVILSKNFELRKNLISFYKSGDHLSVTAGNEFQLLYFRTINLSSDKYSVDEIRKVCQYIFDNYIFDESRTAHFISSTKDDDFAETIRDEIELDLQAVDFHDYFKDYIDIEKTVFLDNDYNSFFAAAAIALRQI